MNWRWIIDDIVLTIEFILLLIIMILSAFLTFAYRFTWTYVAGIVIPLILIVLRFAPRRT
jgi:hypothetical protein